MPGVTVHLRLAQRVLEHWSSYPRDAPFPSSDGRTVNAFQVGAFGPDLGYFPGGHRPLSDLAHCLASGDLSRALVDRAGSLVERAWAAGWVTHVLADTLIHPLVGCAVGELTLGTPGSFVDGDRDPVSHVRVEAGLDALYAVEHPELRALRLTPTFGPGEVGFIVGAYDHVYGLRPELEQVYRSSRNAVRRARQGLGLAALTSMVLSPGAMTLRTGEGDHAGPISRMRARLGSSSVALGYLLPVASPIWLVEAVREIERDFVDLFLEAWSSRLPDLDNLNLDTGRPDGSDAHHGGFLRALAYLDGREELHETPAVTAVRALGAA